MKQPVTSQTIDYFLALGIESDHLSRSLMSRPDLELRLRDGQLSIWRNGVCMWAHGQTRLELTVDDWRTAAAKLGAC